MTQEHASATPVVSPDAPRLPKKKKRKSKAGKRILTLLFFVVLGAIIAVVLYLFVFKASEEGLGTPMTQPAMRSSIQSVVEGSGMTRAKDSAVVIPESGGTILELYVMEGDMVMEGQPLYTMDDTKAQEAVAAAQEVVDDCNTELQALYAKTTDLTVTAPHAGNLREVGEFKTGDTVSEGTVVATIVNDTKLKLSLYYSYAYEYDIHVGDSAQIAIPATMSNLTGTVEAVNKVRFISPEGSAHFEVVFVMDNPGTLTEGMVASATLADPSGNPIYPYENGGLQYYETTEVKAKATGPVELVSLLNYADVQAGTTLMILGAQDNDAEISAKENALREAQENLDLALETRGNFNAVAPISGTVLSCNLMAGAEVPSGGAITIADTTVMTIEIQVDERNVRYVSPGMMVDIDQYGTYYMGIVESVSQTADAQNGVATFPAVVKVDNFDGLLMSNMYVSYSFIASESNDCLVVPVQAVKYVSLPDGEEMSNATVIFVETDTVPDNAIEADPSWECPEGFVPMVVETGLADNMNVEIVSGLTEGDFVFLGYETLSGDSFNW